jgi:hypothetical protein
LGCNLDYDKLQDLAENHRSLRQIMGLGESAAANGFKNDGVNAAVTVNIPPLSGLAANKPYCAEVLITYNQVRFFSNIFGTGKLPVTARAVARGRYTSASPGILILDPTDNNTLNVTASGGVTVTNGGAIDVDSKSPNGGATCTNTGNITADNINLSDYTCCSGR